jgi:hypothetical protein
LLTLLWHTGHSFLGASTRHENFTLSVSYPRIFFPHMSMWPKSSHFQVFVKMSLW